MKLAPLFFGYPAEIFTPAAGVRWFGPLDSLFDSGLIKGMMNALTSQLVIR